MRIGFRDCVVDTDARQVLRNGAAVPLSPKAFSLLEVLTRARPKAVSKEQIHEALWPKTFVSGSSLGNLVVELREALGDVADRPEIIRTVPRFGYAFCADARELEDRSPDRLSAGVPAYRLILGLREFALDQGEHLIGRDRDATVWIDDESVSRRHAYVRVGDAGAILEDLGSKNGTYLNGKKVISAMPLSDRDAMEVGSVSLVFRVLQRPGSTQSRSRPQASR